MFFFYRYGDHRDLRVLTHSFPTRRSSDLNTYMIGRIHTVLTMIKVICQGWSAPTIGQTRGPPLPRAPITSPPKISDRPPPMNGPISTMLRARGRCLREKYAAASATAAGYRPAPDRTSTRLNSSH